MGYVFCVGTCFGCSGTFSFNPNKVPSINYKGERRPICSTCVARVNPMRKAKGLEPIIPAPDAYECCAEGEL